MAKKVKKGWLWKKVTRRVNPKSSKKQRKGKRRKKQKKGPVHLTL